MSQDISWGAPWVARNSGQCKPQKNMVGHLGGMGFGGSGWCFVLDKGSVYFVKLPPASYSHSSVILSPEGSMVLEIRRLLAL